MMVESELTKTRQELKTVQYCLLKNSIAQKVKELPFRRDIPVLYKEYENANIRKMSVEAEICWDINRGVIINSSVEVCLYTGLFALPIQNDDKILALYGIIDLQNDTFSVEITEPVKFMDLTLTLEVIEWSNS